jgi:hypothetical protein
MKLMDDSKIKLWAIARVRALLRQAMRAAAEALRRGGR